eukprot:764958-Hanusia_phi.AAC.2
MQPGLRLYKLRERSCVVHRTNGSYSTPPQQCVNATLTVLVVSLLLVDIVYNTRGPGVNERRTVRRKGVNRGEERKAEERTRAWIDSQSMPDAAGDHLQNFPYLSTPLHPLLTLPRSPSLVLT